MNERLYGQFEKIEWLFRRLHQRSHRDHGPMGDPRRGQGRILSMLGIKPGMSQKELSYLLGIKPQSLGELLAKLEKKGYVSRETSQDDHRMVMVSLTETGRAAAESETPAGPADVFGCLSDDEQNELSGYLDRLIQALESVVGEDEPEEERPRPHPLPPHEHGPHPLPPHENGPEHAPAPPFGKDNERAYHGQFHPHSLGGED